MSSSRFAPNPFDKFVHVTNTRTKDNLHKWKRAMLALVSGMDFFHDVCLKENPGMGDTEKAVLEEYNTKAKDALRTLFSVVSTDQNKIVKPLEVAVNRLKVEVEGQFEETIKQYETRAKQAEKLKDVTLQNTQMLMREREEKLANDLSVKPRGTQREDSPTPDDIRDSIIFENAAKRSQKRTETELKAASTRRSPRSPQPRRSHRHRVRRQASSSPWPSSRDASRSSSKMSRASSQSRGTVSTATSMGGTWVNSGHSRKKSSPKLMGRILSYTEASQSPAPSALGNVLSDEETPEEGVILPMMDNLISQGNQIYNEYEQHLVTIDGTDEEEWEEAEDELQRITHQLATENQNTIELEKKVSSLNGMCQKLLDTLVQGKPGLETVVADAGLLGFAASAANASATNTPDITSPIHSAPLRSHDGDLGSSSFDGLGSLAAFGMMNEYGDLLETYRQLSETAIRRCDDEQALCNDSSQLSRENLAQQWATSVPKHRGDFTQLLDFINMLRRSSREKVGSVSLAGELEDMPPASPTPVTSQEAIEPSPTSSDILPPELTHATSQNFLLKDSNETRIFTTGLGEAHIQNFDRRFGHIKGPDPEELKQKMAAETAAKQRGISEPGDSSRVKAVENPDSPKKSDSYKNDQPPKEGQSSEEGQSSKEDQLSKKDQSLKKPDSSEQSELPLKDKQPKEDQLPTEVQPSNVDQMSKKSDSSIKDQSPEELQPSEEGQSSKEDQSSKKPDSSEKDLPKHGDSPEEDGSPKKDPPKKDEKNSFHDEGNQKKSERSESNILDSDTSKTTNLPDSARGDDDNDPDDPGDDLTPTTDQCTGFENMLLSWLWRFFAAVSHYMLSQLESWKRLLKSIYQLLAYLFRQFTGRGKSSRGSGFAKIEDYWVIAYHVLFLVTLSIHLDVRSERNRWHDANGITRKMMLTRIALPPSWLSFLGVDKVLTLVRACIDGLFLIVWKIVEPALICFEIYQLPQLFNDILWPLGVVEDFRYWR
ncbi:hypothetical protein FGRMN_5853 [Fusarium graminum]|nr:hypothetical protein FGRMN_5853 [Fusarium graminum]